jgi:F0F1-type ATP synthase assembly protein I
MILLVAYYEAGMSRWAAAFRLFGLGFYVAACILSGVLAGLWLDNKFSTKPLFILLGLAAGLAVAFYGVYRMIRLVMNNKQGKEND